MRRQMIGTKKVCGVQVSYWLLGNLSNEGATVYGIAVERSEECVEYADLSSSQEEVVKLLKSLVSGRVTPVTAGDVVEDWLLR